MLPNCSRRAVLHAGLGALGIGLLHATGAAAIPRFRARPGSARFSPDPRSPFTNVADDEPSLVVDGMRFARWWSGDSWAFDAMPFHSCENCFEGDRPPVATEEVDVAIVGGGLSGLACAYLLRHRDILLLEMRDRLGGNAMGERWDGVPYSLGSAYFIAPDPGTFLESLYRELGFAPGVAVDEGELAVVLNGAIVPNVLAAPGVPPDQQALFRKYADLVTHYAERAYPEIPLPDGERADWILRLDEVSLRSDIERKIGAPIPPLLAAAVQAYCYSSFGAGWDEISAASGWNFIAAEEFGRWILPGGNAGLAEALWRPLRAAETARGKPLVRTGCRVVDVRLAPDDRVQVTWRDGAGALHALRARHVIMANSKHVAKWMIHDLDALDAAKLDAMHNVPTSAYVVANVLLSRPVPHEFYDLFLLDNGTFPMDPIEAESRSAVVDVLNGEFSGGNGRPSTVLTLYWPLPWPAARFTIAEASSLEEYATRLAPQVRRMLETLDVGAEAVRQVRLTRWGHAMPVAKPGAIATGQVDHLRRPIAEKIWFVNQDNWLLPAVETCLLEAKTWTDAIAARLDRA